MKKTLFFALLIILGIGCNSKLKAQFVYDGWKGGVQLGPLLPEDDYKFGHALKYSYYLRGFFRTQVTPALQAEIGAATGRFTGNDVTGSSFSTDLFPLDARLLISPPLAKKVIPYIYAGVGQMYYSLQKFGGVGNESGWLTTIPFGIGFEFNMNNATSYEVSAGINYRVSNNMAYMGSANAGSVFYNFTIGMTVPFEKQNDDVDGDGLTDHQEELLKTNLHNPDTDGDGLTDGDEVLKYHTDPLLKDTDGDGLSDYDEVMVYHTDPLKRDTDGDGLSDGDEVLKFHTDPLKWDTDGDGLSDGDEAHVHHTDPFRADTDADGLADGAEIITYHTDPLKMDTDGDLLSDGDEVLKYHTDPLKFDTDGGGIGDGAEIAQGTNPLDKNDDHPTVVQQPKLGETISLEGIEFKTGSAEILPSSTQTLEKVFATLNSYANIEVEIHGHTDNVGTRAKNIKLSEERAESVKSFLTGKGINPGRITTKGFGPDSPLAPNTTESGRQKNRRIEFVRTK